MYVVYKLVERKSGKFYVGSCTDLEKRVARHIQDLKRREHHCSRLQKLVNKYGMRLKVVMVKEYPTRSGAYRREQRLLDKYYDDPRLLNTGMCAIGGDNLSRNENRDMVIQKIKKSMQKLMDSMSPEQRKEKFANSGSSNGMYGKTHSASAKEKMSIAMLGNSHAKGAIRSDAYKENLRQTRLAESSQEGYVNNFAGKRHKKSTKKIISDKHKARMSTPGFVHAQAKAVAVGKIKYISVVAAAKALGVCPATIVYRLKSNNYPDYSYL